MTGKVYLVGAGPWDPGLLTLRGKELIGRADLILYDYLVNPELLAHAARSGSNRGRLGATASKMTQEEICACLVKAGLAGLQVVRLKGGDPFVFGRGGEEAALSLRRCSVRSRARCLAAVASAAYAGIPVTHREYGSTFGFVTGHFMDDGPDDQVDWPAVSK